MNILAGLISSLVPYSRYIIAMLVVYLLSRITRALWRQIFHQRHLPPPQGSSDSPSNTADDHEVSDGEQDDEVVEICPNCGYPLKGGCSC